MGGRQLVCSDTEERAMHMTLLLQESRMSQAMERLIAVQHAAAAEAEANWQRRESWEDVLPETMQSFRTCLERSNPPVGRA